MKEQLTSLTVKAEARKGGSTPGRIRPKGSKEFEVA
jgi:hypothetical protein